MNNMQSPNHKGKQALAGVVLSIGCVTFGKLSTVDWIHREASSNNAASVEVCYFGRRYRKTIEWASIKTIENWKNWQWENHAQ